MKAMDTKTNSGPTVASKESGIMKRVSKGLNETGTHQERVYSRKHRGCPMDVRSSICESYKIVFRWRMNTHQECHLWAV